jgi:hypothetical protein
MNAAALNKFTPIVLKSNAAMVVNGEPDEYQAHSDLRLAATHSADMNVRFKLLSYVSLTR